MFNTLRHMPSTVIALGLVSLLMDLSSETIHALLPLFMVQQLGLSMLSVGLLDGFAEALTLWCKPISGWLSDRQQQRKPLTMLGYGLAALAKPLFALSQGIVLLASARLIDRVGKGIRGAPRDALIADVTPREMRGAAYGLRQSMDTVGALLAPLCASALLWFYTDDMRLIFWLASIPAVLAVIVLIVGVKEVPAGAPKPQAKSSSSLALAPLWPIFLLAFLFTLARPSEAFLLLRAQNIGFTVASTPLVLALMNAVYALSAWPFGVWFDRIGAAILLRLSLLLLLLAMVCLSVADNVALVLAAAILWGLHMGCSQGVLAAVIARHAPSAKRGRSFGIYAFCVGTALLLNGVAFGGLWQSTSAAFAFMGCALMAGVALISSVPLLRRIHELSPA